ATISSTADWNGSETITFTAEDEGGLTVDASADFIVGADNDAPTVSSPVSATESEDGSSFSLNLLANASDKDVGDTLLVTGLVLVSGDASGITSSANALNVDPSAYNALASGESEVITYSYQISDGNGGLVDQTATITIVGENDGPTVSGDVVLASINEDQSIRITAEDLLANVSDADGDALTVTDLLVNSGDGIILQDSGDWIFTPEENWSGQVQLSYSVSDGNDVVSTAASLAVLPVPDGVVLNDMQVTATSNTYTPVTFSDEILALSTEPLFSLVASNVPTDIQFNRGTDLGGGEWSFSVDDIENLYVVADGIPVTSAIEFSASAMNNYEVAEEYNFDGSTQGFTYSESQTASSDRGGVSGTRADINGGNQGISIQFNGPNGNGNRYDDLIGEWSNSFYNSGDGNTVAIAFDFDVNSAGLDWGENLYVSVSLGDQTQLMYSFEPWIGTSTQDPFVAVFENVSGGAQTLTITAEMTSISQSSEYARVYVDNLSVVELGYTVVNQSVDLGPAYVDVGFTYAQVDTSETVSLITISSLPDGSILTDGVNSVTVDSSGLVDITGWNTALLELAVAAGVDSTFDAIITVESLESDGEAIVNTATLTVDVATFAPEISTTDVSLVEVAESVTVLFSGEEYSDAQGQSPDNANGIAADNFVLSARSDVTVTFLQEDAGYLNTLGYYVVDADGFLSGSTIIWGEGEDDGPGAPLSAGVSASFTDLPEGQLGFFMAQNAYDYFATEIDAAAAGNGFIRFENTAGDLAHIDDTGVQLVYYSAGTEANPSGDRVVFVNPTADAGGALVNTFHSLAAGLNTDGILHVRSGIEPGDPTTLRVGFEDLAANGFYNPYGHTNPDWDFNDFEINVNIVNHYSSAASVADDLTLSDNGDSLQSALVQLDVGRAGDVLILDDAAMSLADSYGISYSYDSATKALSFTGEASVTEYQTILREIKIANGDELGDAPRSVDFMVTDIDGLISDTARVNLNPDSTYDYSGDDFLAGDSGDNILFGGEGADILFGAAGNDQLEGGGGSDRFLWNSDSVGDTDTLLDFEMGIGGDILDLADLLDGESADASSLDAYFDFSSDGTDTTIRIDSSGTGDGTDLTLVLTGVDLALLGDDQAILQQLLNNGNIYTD
ncbi:cadherin-like domain-containing protein, partial [Teredinibacter waterburyi]|uniref:cadherin-like domain-containing protein n=1 Tax=Teredinibacter waterburyi TaxID=1500538 RepID=UPI00165F9DF5